MPNVTLRLTDLQHAQLKQEAADAHRSLQGEILHRLFVEIPTMAVRLDGAEAYGPVELPERLAKPDPKPERKKK